MAVHLLSTTVHHTMPGNYVRPETQQRRRLAEVVSGARIPVVDLASPDRAAVAAAICGACRRHGFFQFQVLNHGIDAGLIADVMAVAREFFRLPAEEKAKLYSDDPARNIRLSTSFNVRKETVHNWRDYLRLHCHPLDPFVPYWPSNPPDFKETMSSNCKEVRELGFQLHAAMSESESIGLEPGYMKDTLGEQDQHMAVNFNPPCPSPELTCGLLAHHTDPNANALTILLMDEDVAGLQVLHSGKWVAVNPHPGALIVGIDDDHLLQVRVEKSAAKAGDPISRRRPVRTTGAAGTDTVAAVAASQLCWESWPHPQPSKSPSALSPRWSSLDLPLSCTHVRRRLHGDGWFSSSLGS